jgi:DNA adenine methylase
MLEPLDGTLEDVLTAVADENRPLLREPAARPFLKWVGGKRSILPELLARLPEAYGTYHEPFLGGGALFFAVQPQAAYLSDMNLPLILAFRAVRDATDALIEELKVHAAKHNKEYYLEMRQRFGRETDEIKLAALLIYLNKTCYNGLYRVNKAGIYNVPMGSYDAPAILDEPNLRLAAQALQGVTIKQHQFDEVPIERGGFYYMDPPYHRTFDGYDSTRFGDIAHNRLAEFCRELHRAGAFFMVSNSDNPFVRSLYKEFHLEQVQAGRYVSCKGDQRGKETELIIRNYE